MRYFTGCDSIAWLARFPASEPCKCRLNHEHRAYEIFALSRLRPRRAAAAAQCRARDDLDLPAHAVAAGRLQLPSPADLFGLWRRGDRALRSVGRRLDDAGAAAALPALGHSGDRQCAAGKTAGRPVVSAVAIRPLARRQRALKLVQLRPINSAAPLSEYRFDRIRNGT